MKYALVLGGGGARGAFEAGVWSKLCEMNKEISAVAGTSVGAINGAAFLSGVKADILWNEIRSDNILPGLKNDNILSLELINYAEDILSGGLDIDPLRKLAGKYISEDRIRASGKDYGLCIYSLKERKIKEIFIDKIPEGNLIDYIIAAASFPVFKNVSIGDEEFTDGGFFNNLPADMLIRRGYANIISVSAGGPGLERDFCGRGVNIIKIKYNDPEQGVMEFNAEAAERSIRLGRLECGRAFGKYLGKKFYILSDSYLRAMCRYGEEVIKGIETAGEIIGVDRYREYSFSDLTRAVMGSYEKNKDLNKEVKRIEKIPGQLMSRVRGNIFYASNSIFYMKKQV